MGIIPYNIIHHSQVTYNKGSPTPKSEPAFSIPSPTPPTLKSDFQKKLRVAGCVLLQTNLPIPIFILIQKPFIQLLPIRRKSQFIALGYGIGIYFPIRDSTFYASHGGHHSTEAAIT